MTAGVIFITPRGLCKLYDRNLEVYLTNVISPDRDSELPKLKENILMPIHRALSHSTKSKVVISSDLLKFIFKTTQYFENGGNVESQKIL